MSEPIMEADELSLRALGVRMVVGLVVFLVVVAVLGVTLRHPLDVASDWFVREFGLVGIFVGVLILDTFPFTIHEPLLLFGVSGGLGYGRVFAAASSASIVAAFTGYAIGRLSARSRWVAALLVRYRVVPLFHRYGIAAIAVAALTPFPYALATWGAGAVGIPVHHLALGALFRIPKVFLYLSLIWLGWGATL